MSKDRKFSLKGYMGWNYDREEKHLNEMSRKGWQMVKGGCFHVTYEKNPHIQYRYRVDYNPSAMKTEEERERYIDTFRADGWEFVSKSFNGWIYLRKEVKENAPESAYEIYSDRQSLLDMFKRFRRLGVLLMLLMLSSGTLSLALAVQSSEMKVYNITVSLCAYAMFFWILYGMSAMKKKQEMIAENQMNKEK